MMCSFPAETVSALGLDYATLVPVHITALRKFGDIYGGLLILDDVMCGVG